MTSIPNQLACCQPIIFAVGAMPSFIRISVNAVYRRDWRRVAGWDCDPACAWAVVWRRKYKKHCRRHPDEDQSVNVVSCSSRRLDHCGRGSGGAL